MSHTPTPQSTDFRTALPSRDDPTIGRLVADASRDISSLIQGEIALVKSELKISVKAGGIGAGLFAAAAFIGVMAVVMLSVALAYFVHMIGIPLAFSFLIVFVLYLLVAGLLAFVGLKKIKQVRAPERAIHQAQETRSILKRG